MESDVWRFRWFRAFGGLLLRVWAVGLVKRGVWGVLRLCEGIFWFRVLGIDHSISQPCALRYPLGGPAALGH